MRSSLLSIGLVVVSGALLRFWNLDHAHVAAVETRVVMAVAQLIHSGSYRPSSLAQPTLPIYLQTSVAMIHFIWGAAAGAWRSVTGFGPEQIIGWGRGFSALIGTAVVFIVFQIGSRWGARHALLAAGLLAVTPLHVSHSRQMADGSALTFFSALTLLLSLIAVERQHRRRFIIAAAAAGLAAACHFAGTLLVLLPLVAVWMTPDEKDHRLPRAALVLVTAVIAFIAANPLAIGDLPAFLNGVAEAAAPVDARVAGGVDRLDILAALDGTLRWPGVILAVAGLILGIVRAVTGPGHTRRTLLVSFPVVQLAVALWRRATPDTALLPLMPAVTVLAAIAVISGVSLLRRFDFPRSVRTALIAALTVAAVLPPALVSIELVRQEGKEERVR